MTTTLDPREIIDNSKMTMLQIFVVAITVMLNAMDGFDVLVISVSATNIAAEWDISRAELGFVLAAELVGMAIGSVLLGGVADKKGRRFTLLLCLGVMASGMFLTTTVSNPVMLCVWRVFTGLGIGGMLSSTNAVVAEFSSKKRRALCISLMVIGYPIGGIIVSLLAGTVLADGGSWRTMFTIGAVVTTALIPVVYFMVPESVQWLARTQPENALDRVNHSLKKLGHSIISALPEISDGGRKRSVMDILSPSMVLITVCITAAYFFHIITFYFILKWTPVIVSDFMNMAPSLAAGVLLWVNIGGALGGLAFGLLSTRIGLKPLTIMILVLSMIGVASFGRTPLDAGNLDSMKMLAAFAGFFGNAGVSGLYALIAYSFPTHIRATGTGFVIGIGRGGAVLSPIIAGFLLQWEVDLKIIAMVMGSGSLLAAVALFFLKVGSNTPADSGTKVVDDETKDSSGMEPSMT